MKNLSLPTIKHGNSVKKVTDKPNMTTNFSTPDLTPDRSIVILMPNMLRNTKSETLDIVPAILKTVSKFKLKHDVSAAFDVKNILSEMVTYIQKKKHAAAFLAILNGQFTAFHNAFCAFFTAAKFYALLILSFSDTSKMLRDNLSLEPRNFQELANHLYAKRFKNAMRIKFAGLKNKNTWKKVSKNETEKDNKSFIPTT